MDPQIDLYTSFSGMSPIEKRALVSFLCIHAGNTTQKNVQEALDYALKRKPSFGGYILIARQQGRTIAAIVVNRTGMKGYSPNHLCVYAAMDPGHAKSEQALLELMRRAIDYTDGDLAMHVEPDSPILQLYTQLGFQPQYLELRLKDRRAIA